MMCRVSVCHFERHWRNVICLQDSIIVSLHSLNWPELWFFCSIYSIEESLKRQARYYFLDSHETRFSTRFLILDSRKFRVSRIESQSLTRKRLSTYIWAVLYLIFVTRNESTWIVFCIKVMFKYLDLLEGPDLWYRYKYDNSLLACYVNFLQEDL